MSAISRYVLLVLFVLVNLVAFALMGVDKQRARTHQWRVPEKTLFLAALLFGGTGGRLDHTLANIQTLHFVTGRGGCGYLYGSGCAMTVLSGETVRIPSRKSGDVSLFALDSTVHGVTIRGLKYTLEDGDITPDFPIGVSNSYIGKRAEITVKQGCALLYFDCDTALPLERQRLL